MRLRKLFIPAIFLSVLVGAMLWHGHPALAQETSNSLTGLESFGAQAGFTTGVDIRIIIARLIRTVLIFLGVIIVCLVLYGGFVWMTAGGNDERVRKAKHILVNSVIGLVIVLSSFIITQFILDAVTQALGVSTSSEESGGGGTYTDGGGGGAAFVLDSINTDCAEIRNLQLQMVFSSAPSQTSVEGGGILVENASGTAVEGTFAYHGNTVTFTPSAICDTDENEFCFDANADYSVVIGSTLENTHGAAISCTIDNPCSFDFHTGSAVDSTAPTVSWDVPVDGDHVDGGDIVLLQTLATDDVGVSTVEFDADGDEVQTAGLSSSTSGSLAVSNYFHTDDTQWDTNGYVTGSEYPLEAIGSDCAGHTATTGEINVRVDALNCSNGVQDTDLGETGVDCGGSTGSAYYCGACEGDSCSVDSDCSEGVCENGLCVTTPRIDEVSPGDGAVDNLVTIAGSGFGSAGGTVEFTGTNGTDTVAVSAYACNGTASWADDQIIVQVPDGAGDGPIAVVTSDAETEWTNDDYGPYIADFDVNQIARPGICSVLDPDTNLDSGPGNSDLTVSGLNFGTPQSTSTLYFTNYEASSYLSWANETISAVIPLLDARNYNTQAFAGDYECVTGAGVGTGTLCSTDADCDTADSTDDDGYTCATSACSEDRTVFCSSDDDCADAGGTCELLRQGSNKVDFTVTSVSSDEPPVISYIDTGWATCDNGTACASDSDCSDGSSCTDAANWGPVGQYVTIYGTGFGTGTGTVKFTNATGSALNDVYALGSDDFPADCSEDYWHDTSITIKVPANYQNANEGDDVGDAMETGLHSLSVVRAEDGLASNGVDFNVVSGDPGPSICSIDPSSGPAGTPVTVVGENFDTGEGTASVTFYDNQSGVVTAFDDGQVLTEVPTDASTGPVVVSDANGYDSNSVSFTVADCTEDASVCAEGTQCCSDGSCSISCSETIPDAHYAYHFSTGPIPEVPTVLVYCGDTDDDGNTDGVSPAPWTGWSDPEQVCVNAAVTATFSMPMETSTINTSNVLVEKCTSTGADPCATTEPVSGDFNSLPSETSFSWSPDGGLFEASTTYQVTLNGGDEAGVLRAADASGGASLADDYVWEFTTASTTDLCEVGGVYVSPSDYTATEDNEEVNYLAQPLSAEDECVALACGTYTWVWDSVSDAVVLGTPTDCGDVVTAVDETPVGDPAEIVASLPDLTNDPSDSGFLTVDFTNPEILSFVPSCGEACVNASVILTFNTTMTDDFNASNVHLYSCEDATCEDGLVAMSLTNGDIVYSEADPTAPTLTISHPDFEKNTYYRIFVSEDLTSTSGVPLSEAVSRCTDSGEVCSFKTRDSDGPCTIDRISVTPELANMSYVGQRQEFTALAYGQPDDCAASGQVLNTSDYDWENWTATDNPNNVSGADVASMLITDGDLALTTDLPNGCSSACLHTGAPVTVDDAVCGDGIVETDKGEDCDGGTGCSSACVHLGTDTVANGGTCGNGTIDAGEDCDGGEACSANCLNEGTSALTSELAECGNGSVDYSVATGGEDCDDGNDKSFDGCSANCLNEGSTPIAEVYATCGNGSVEDGEDCDDFNATDGDGCSSVCLREGAQGTYGTCGDGIVDQGSDGEGEDCDGGEGCSLDCLWIGPNANYETASFCGDGTVGTGEECDATDASSATVGPYGVAEVELGSAQEADANDGYAVSDIGASVNNVDDEATLSLACDCEVDAACGSTATLGCGVSGCCFERPKETGANPASGTTDACLNTAVWVTFNQMMDEDSLDQSVDADGNGVISATEYDPQIYLQLITYNGAAVTSCPTDAINAGYYTAMAAPAPSGNVFVRAWHWVANGVRRLFGQPAYAISTSTCIVPVTYSVEPTTGAGSKVRLNYDELLLPNALYYVNTAGDPNVTDGNAEGALSINGVGINITLRRSTSFTTGTEVCELEEVDAQDLGKSESFTNVLVDPSPGYFSTSNEEHVLDATPYTIRSSGALEEISPTSGYDWSWNWGDEISDTDPSNVVTTTALADTEGSATSGENNGREEAIATAEITANDADTSDIGSQVYGTVDLTVFVCENPWPDVDSYPYVEDTVNYSFSYCRDAGEDGTTDDLPALTAVSVPSPLSGIYAEYLYEVEGTNDAIGVRVIPDTDYLPPDLWYDAQGFTGGASETEVDGYEAVSDGNTLYVLVGNQVTSGSNTNIYPNIYVISYNENASAESQEVFDQMLQSWRFNANSDEVTDVNLCYDDATASYLTDDAGDFVSCSWDADCDAVQAGAICDANKAKLTRDMRRLSDMVRMKDAVDAYGDDHGHCSVTTSQECSSDADCSGGEECLASVPELASGSYLRSASASAWPSWTSALANDLGTALPNDPINQFVDCPDGYASDTCWNSTDNRFQCPTGSHVYGFRSIAASSYELYAELEYDGAPWFYDLDTDSSDTSDLTAEYENFTGSGSLPDGFERTPVLCDGGIIGDSSFCGDGVLGAGEVCEYGDITTSACDADSDGTDDGTVTLGCKADCSGYEALASLSADELATRCIQFQCGNGVVEDGETCDDGELNGSYGHCSADCGSATFYCGDGYLAGGEQCDCGTSTNFTDVIGDHHSWAYLNGCTDGNGQYAEDMDVSCAFDCTAPGPSCGDLEVNGGEECDGDYLEWAGALCHGGDNDKQECTTDDDCPAGTCGGTTNTNACGTSQVCVGGLDAGDQCSSSSDCDLSTNNDHLGTCSAFTYDLFRYRTCGDPSGANACDWDNWSACVGGDQTCGDGVVEGDEACDDGNDSNNDSCLNTCVANVCGDDYVYTGVESCDSGSDNGATCDSSYGGTCNYCSITCQYQTLSGEYCGDGIRNGTEACDGTDIPYYCFNNASNLRDRGGECDPDEAGTQGSCDAGFTCRKLGVCNGGDFNGQYCTRDSGVNYTNQATLDTASCGPSSDGATCEYPVCASDCGTSCPVSFDASSLLVQSELAGASEEEDVDLHSYLSGETPDNAVIYVPACTVGTELTADISLQDVIPPSLDIVFLTDLSGSMTYDVEGNSGAAVGDRRIDYVVDATENAISDIIDTYAGRNGTVQIGLASFRASDGHEDLGFTDDTSDLTSMVESYATTCPDDTAVTCPAGGTPTSVGVDTAIGMFDDSTADVKIIVLLSDGDPSSKLDGSGCSGTDCVEEVTGLDDDAEEDPGIEFFTAVIADDTSLQGYMAHFSSDECGTDWDSTSDCDAVDNIEYAYQATDADGVSTMYEAIIDSILGATVSFTTDVNGTATVTSGSVRDGDNVILPFPEGFSCDGTSFTIPLNISFNGTGTVNMGNFSFTNCPAE